MENTYQTGTCVYTGTCQRHQLWRTPGSWPRVQGHPGLNPEAQTQHHAFSVYFYFTYTLMLL